MKMTFAAALGGTLLVGLLAAGTLTGSSTSAEAATACGKASWYAMTSRTASGERANPNAMTAAHRTLPFGTRVKVVNLVNRRSVVVRINDRGPFIRGRIIDVSKAAARKLGMVATGTASVRISASSGKRLGGRC